MYLKQVECEGVDWIQPVQNSVQLRAIVSAVVSFWIPNRWEISWSAEWISDSERTSAYR